MAVQEVKFELRFGARCGTFGIVQHNDPMKYQIATMPTHELAERIGSLASDAETETFRKLAIAAGFGNSTASDIPDAQWYSMIQKISEEGAS